MTLVSGQVVHDVDQVVDQDHDAEHPVQTSYRAQRVAARLKLTDGFLLRRSQVVGVIAKVFHQRFEVDNLIDSISEVFHLVRELLSESHAALAFFCHFESV